MVQQSFARAAKEFLSAESNFLVQVKRKGDHEQPVGMVHVLRQHGHYVEVHKCQRLGNILWQDTFQVAAFPSKLDTKITPQ